MIDGAVIAARVTVIRLCDSPHKSVKPIRKM